MMKNSPLLEFIQSYHSEIESSDSSVWIHDHHSPLSVHGDTSQSIHSASIEPTSGTFGTTYYPTVNQLTQNQFIPLVGNGRFSITPISPLQFDTGNGAYSKFHIRGKRILDVAIPFDPIINVAEFGTHTKCNKNKMPTTIRLQQQDRNKEPVIEIPIGGGDSDDDLPPPPPIPSQRIPPPTWDARAREDPPVPQPDLNDRDYPPMPPPSPRRDNPQLGGERRSLRHRRAPEREGNVYPPGTLTDKDRRKALKSNQQASGLDSDIADQSDNQGTYSQEQIAELARKGGARFWSFLMAQAVPYNEPEPSRVREWTDKDIRRLPENEQREWRKAQLEELESLKKRQVYEVVDRPQGRNIVKNRWVYDIKSDGRKKARLVAKGFSQIEGLDYDEIFSPVVRFESVRIILALAVLEKWSIEALDVKTAFLYGKLDEEIYMEQPSGFQTAGKDKVLRLKRAIYGLKQAARAWWIELDKSLKDFGFHRIYADAGIFICRHEDGTYAIMLAYVDDIIITGPDYQVTINRKKLFMERWECRDLGECKEFLRMRIRQQDGAILIDQVSYLDKVLKRFGMTDGKVAQTPMPTGYKPVPYTGSASTSIRAE